MGGGDRFAASGRRANQEPNVLIRMSAGDRLAVSATD
jgi:hypothetical protein